MMPDQYFQGKMSNLWGSGTGQQAEHESLCGIQSADVLVAL